MEFETVLTAVRHGKPLVQCITNFVTVNDCANIILASGGRPTMASHLLEVEDAVRNVQALVCNMGAIDHMESMILAGKEANRLGKPVVLDPVGAGGTRLRQKAVKQLIDQVHFTAIRGNASEIRYLAGQQSTGSGVDVSDLDEITEGNLDAAISMAADLAKELDTVIAISGKIDVDVYKRQARSRDREPVGMASTTAWVFSPSRMMDPLPKLRSIWATAVSSAFCLSLAGPADSRGGFFAAMSVHPFRVLPNLADALQISRFSISDILSHKGDFP